MWGSGVLFHWIRVIWTRIKFIEMENKELKKKVTKIWKKISKDSHPIILFIDLYILFDVIFIRWYRNVFQVNFIVNSSLYMSIPNLVLWTTHTLMKPYVDKKK